MKAAIIALLLLLAALPAAAQVQPLTAWWIDTGDTDSTGLGNQIAPLGDINGDGLNDIVVAATGAEKLYVYLGSTQPDTIPYMVINRPDSRLKWFGVGLYSVGDVNNDGHLDFGVQATRHDIPPEHMFVYIYFGGPMLDTIPDLMLDGGTPPYSHFGRNGAGLGDINGDGGKDFGILDDDYTVNISPLEIGRIYLYYGGSLLDSIPDIIINADSAYNRIAHSLAPMGDINSDGFADFAMSRSDCQGAQGQLGAGIIAIYYGGFTPDTLPDILIRGSQTTDALGGSLASLDWNNDDQLDIIAGNAIHHPPSYSSSIYLYLVSDSMSGQPNRMFMDEGVPGYGIGSYIFGMDLNGDGWQDIVDCENASAFGRGRVYVFLGGPNADSLYDATYYRGSNTNAGLGSGACNAGDMNGDWIDDLPGGEPGYGNPYDTLYYGRLHLILGNDTLHQSGVEPGINPSTPNSFGIQKAYPNPFNSSVVIELYYPSFSNPKLKVYNLQGGLVREFQLNFNQKRIVWDGLTSSGLQCASGIYIAAMTTTTHQSYKMIVLLH